MQDTKELVRQYLRQVNIMQLATSVDDKPWACTVHFYNDEDFNFYWCSTPDRRHSQEIAQNPNVAVTIMAHENTPEENYVVGISVTGSAQLMDSMSDQAIEGYMQKLNKDPNLPADITSGKNPGRFYKLTPDSLVIFDNKNFADNPRQEIKL